VVDGVKKFTVLFIGYGAVQVVTSEQIRRVQAHGVRVPIPELRPGARVTVKYAPDGKYYAAKIESKVPGGWRVTYQQYGNEEVVPYEYIRAMSKTTEEGGEDEFVIPEHLKVLDTDTEKERNRKRKAVKAIKNSFRQHQIEKAHEAKKSTWAQFQTKASKKKVPGFVSTGVKRDSIFKTPDAPDAKVGVVGSGQGMTDFDSKRKRLRA